MNNFKKGFSLVETMVAISIIIFSILGPLTLTSFSLKASSTAKNNLIAGSLAQEGIELIRAKRGDNVLSGGSANWLFGMGNPGGSGTICFDARGCSIDAYDLNPQVCPSGASACILRFDGVYNHKTGNPSTNPDTIFKRIIKLTEINPGIEVRMIVTVSWVERFGNQSVTVEENMFNWQ